MRSCAYINVVSVLTAAASLTVDTTAAFSTVFVGSNRRTAFLTHSQGHSKQPREKDDEQQHEHQSRQQYSTSLSMSTNGADDKYDLIVVGAGPVGVQAALSAASAPYNKKVCLVDAPRASGMLMDEKNNQDLSIGGPTGLFSKALRDTSKRISVTSLRGMGLREDRCVVGMEHSMPMIFLTMDGVP